MLEKYLKIFGSLRTDKNRKRYPAVTRHRAPHKPTLLLSVIDLIEQGIINQNFIEPSLDLVETFNTYISMVLPPGWKTSMAHPFPRLQKDGFWHRVANPGYNPDKDYNVTSISKLNEIYAGARMDDELFHLMLIPETRTRLRTVLIDTYFAPELQPVLLEQASVNIAAYEYSQDLIKSIKQKPHWGKGADKPEKNNKIRDQGFRKAIVQLYDHRCALCGIRMLTPEGHTVVEAAHIMPWSRSYDDKPTNGLALCRLCHWSFDEGLMSVGKSYEVLVSKRVRTDQNIPGHMMTLADRPIFKPQGQNFWPAQTNIEWHRKLVYRK
jgi:putative restriction endonuclease